MILKRLGTDSITITPTTNWPSVTLVTGQMISVSREMGICLKDQYGATLFEECADMTDNFSVIVD